MEKKLSKSVKLNLMYMNQLYNKTVIEGEGGVIHSDIFIADAKFKLASKATLRTEVQYLSTKDDDGDWLFGLADFHLHHLGCSPFQTCIIVVRLIYITTKVL